MAERMRRRGSVEMGVLANVWVGLEVTLTGLEWKGGKVVRKFGLVGCSETDLLACQCCLGSARFWGTNGTGRRWTTRVVEECRPRGHAAVFLGWRNGHDLGLGLAHHRGAVLLRFHDDTLRADDLGIRHDPTVVDDLGFRNDPSLEDHARFDDGLRLVDQLGFHDSLGLRQDVLVDDGSAAVDDLLLGHEPGRLLDGHEAGSTGRRWATRWALRHAG